MARDETQPATSAHMKTPTASGADRVRTVAFVMSPALGDTLNLLVVAHNLWLAGWRVNVFGDHAHSLAAWFPHLTIAPALMPGDARHVLASYPFVVQMHRDRPLADLRGWHPGFIDLHDVEYAKNGDCMARRFADFAATRFGLPSVVVSNGISPPTSLRGRRHTSRVAVHPEASTADKRWTPQRFVELARHLRTVGLRAEFALDARELPRWDSRDAGAPPLRTFASTAALAEWLYESAWFIGNDSGVGHLASSLGVPTLTVFRRRRIAQRWRPGFAPGAIVYPPWWVPTAGLKERWWRESITVRRVLASFHALRSRTAVQSDGAASEWMVQ